jgi:pyruvate kinase
VRRTKIVSTLGPRSRSPDRLLGLIEAGTDVVRLNFAHDTPASHEEAAASARRDAARAGRFVGVLADLPGPKMRTGPVRGGEVHLRAGSQFVLSARGADGDGRRVATSVAGLAKMVSPGDKVFLADGEIVLRVESVEGDDVNTRIERGGLLRSRKGMHLPGKEQDLEAFTDDDKKALDVALRMSADYIGLSFVRSADDVRRVREEISKEPVRPHLVAKIETALALDHLDDIVREADVVMVARGDLGIQTPLSHVPLVQKQIIHTCNEAGTPVITATEMLESMTHEALPTRAEVTDVANAVVDGTDALMLSEETAVGEDPAGAVRTMSEIAEVAEAWPNDHAHPEANADEKVGWSVAAAAVRAAQDLGAAAIVCPVRTGATALRVAAFRPVVPVVALCAAERVVGRLALAWGVTPIATPSLGDTDGAGDTLDEIMAAGRNTGFVESGQVVVVVAASGPPTNATSSIHVLTA